MVDWTVLCLFGGGAVFAALTALLRKRRPLWALLAAVCTAAGVLTGLALGWTLGGLLTPMLVVCVVSMTALLLGKEDGG